jgi:hypothetical protein
VGKETEGTSNGAGRYRNLGRRCGTLCMIDGSRSRPAAPLWRRATRMLHRLRADYLPELVAATELLVPMEFRHHTARLDSTRST